MHYDACEKTGLQGQIQIVVEPKDPDPLQRGKVVRTRWKSEKNDEERATVGMLIKTSLLATNRSVVRGECGLLDLSLDGLNIPLAF